MKNWKKIALIIGGVVVLLAIVGFTVQQTRKGVVTVQTGKVVREDMTSVVTASGEIKPKVHVNIGSNAFAKITHLYVKEGDRVKKGQMLATLDNVQSSVRRCGQRCGAECFPHRCGGGAGGREYCIG